MSKEMQDALEQENKAKDAIEKLEKENEAKMPKEMWKSNPTSEELAAEYDQWRHARQKEHAEWEKSLEEKQNMEALSRELAKCPCSWEHMNAYRILMQYQNHQKNEKMKNKPDADNTAVEQCKTNQNNEESHNFDQEMARHYDEWFKKAVLYDSYLGADNTVAEQSRTNENNEEFRHYEAAKVKEYEDWFEAKKH
jgi:hypothetical protein